MILEISRLEKKLGNAERMFHLGPFDLTVREGEVIGVFGRNGAGKSTFFNLLSGRQDTTSGEVKLNDQLVRPDRPDVRRLIGYLEQEAELPPWLAVSDILRSLALFYKIDSAEQKISALMQYWGIDLFQNKMARDCSYGMQKRVRLALTQLIKPEVFVLDEPINGLDLEYVRQFSKVLKEWQAQKKIVFLSLHSAHFAAIHCNRVVFFEHGTARDVTGWNDASVDQRILSLESLF